MSCVDGRQLNNQNRKVRLAIALLFNPSDQARKELLVARWTDSRGRFPSRDCWLSPFFCRSVRDIAFDHFSLAEHFMQRLQHNVLRAYYSRSHFPALIQEAIRIFERDLKNVMSSASSSDDPIADVPVYLALASTTAATSNAQQVAHRFMTHWESVIVETDTKLTHLWVFLALISKARRHHAPRNYFQSRALRYYVIPFSFWSSLLSAVLTYHVNWLHSFVRQPVDFFDCGTRVLILSKDANLVRCGDIHLSTLKMKILTFLFQYVLNIDRLENSCTSSATLSAAAFRLINRKMMRRLCRALHGWNKRRWIAAVVRSNPVNLQCHRIAVTGF